VDFKNNSAQKPQKITKAENENFEPSIVCIFKETKAKFLFHKN